MHHTFFSHNDLPSIFQILQLANAASYMFFVNLFHILTKCYLYFCEFGRRDILEKFQTMLPKYFKACKVSYCCGYSFNKLEYIGQFQVIKEISFSNAEDFADKSGNRIIIKFKHVSILSIQMYHFVVHISLNLVFYSFLYNSFTYFIQRKTSLIFMLVLLLAILGCKLYLFCQHIAPF